MSCDKQDGMAQRTGPIDVPARAPVSPGTFSVDGAYAPVLQTIRAGQRDQEGSIRLFTSLEVRVGDRVLLEDGSLDVHLGEITVLVGPSGVGKSVLADVAFGLSPQGPGDPIQITGEVGDAGRRGGLAVQHGGGLGHLTLSENLALVSTDRKRNNEILNGLDLEPARLASPLSGGERRRLVVARALAASRDLLWLDEPAAGLDAALAADLAAQLRQHASQFGVAILVTSHQPDFISSVADRVVFLGHDGALDPLGGAESRDAASLGRELRLRITEAERRPWVPVRSWRPAMRWGAVPSIIAEGMAGSASVLTGRNRVARSTLRRAWRLGAVEGALFYPFVGAIFAAIFILVIEMAIAFKPTWDVLRGYGPVLVVRFSPAMAAILVAARAGSSISAWYGQLTLQRHFETLRILSPRAIRSLVAPGWIGLTGAGILATLSFAAALTAVFCVHLAAVGQMAEIPTLLGNFDPRTTFAALAKTAGFSAVVAACTLAYALQPKRRVDLVATDLTQGIMLSTVAVMLAELGFLLVEFVT